MEPRPAALLSPAAPLRVVLTGAESTGKTTLAARLAAHYGTVWVPEYARVFVEARGRPVEAADVGVIARGHLDAVAAAVPRARRVLVCDTDLVSTCVYSRYYYGACPAWVERAARRHRADLYLLADTDVPWQPDPGQRDSPEARAVLDARFREALRRRGLPHVVVAGPVDARLHAAVAAVDALLRGQPAP